MKKLLLLLSLLFGYTFTHADELFYENYKWDEPIKLPLETDEDKIVLKDKEVVEFAHQKNTFYEFNLTHKIVYLGTSKQVESNNKLYIPLYSDAEVLEPKARVIKPNNEIVELDKSKILTSKDEETGQSYKYFAFEGLEEGSIIEYQYVIKRNANYDGARRFIQSNYPIHQYEFDVYAPWNLVFVFKVMNDTNTVQLDTTMTEKNHWYLHLDSIPKLEDEFDAPYYWLIKKLSYKLDRILNSGERDYTSYGKLSTSYYTSVYEKVEKSETKAISKLLKEIKVPKNADDEEKIRTAENYLKSNIRVVEFSAPELTDISSITSTKVASKFGITRLFANLLNKMGIKHELVLTCETTYGRFDKEFESYINVTDYLIYFPGIKKYIAPTEFEYRLGIIPASFADNYGLFIEETSLGDFKTGIGTTKYIKPLPYEETLHNLDVKVALNDDLSEVNLDISKATKGLYAVYTQPYLGIVNEEVRKNIVEEDLKSLLEHMEIEEWGLKNDDANLVGIEPLVINCKAQYNDLIENAGDKYLVKVGELIGPQMELYSKDERKLPVYSDFKRYYERKIVVEIPEGFKIANLDDLNINTSYNKDGEDILKFESKYNLNGSTLTIDIIEYYDQMYFEVEEYPNYRAVINSASDFNKVVLVFEKG